MRLQKRNLFAWARLQNRTMHVFLAVFGIVTMAFGPLTQVARADFASMTINTGTTGNFTVGQPWTLNVNSSFPNTAFNLCAIHPNGVQDCTPAGTLFPGNGSTNAIGAWTGTGSFDQTAVGAWTEWAQFPSGVQSNQITYTVAAITPPSASMAINGATSGTFSVKQAWTLNVSSNLANQNVLLCGIHPNGVQDCVSQLLGVNIPATDASGNWSLQGSFDPTTVGAWTEWLEFPSANSFTSNRITFTVSAPQAAFTINGAATGTFTLGQNWALRATTNLPSQNVLICAIHPTGLQDCSTQVNGRVIPPTDANGNWIFSGFFDPADLTIPGTWTEWLQFPSANNFTSNRITFTVVPPVSANLTINGSVSGNFLVGQAWALHVTSTVLSSAFNLCAIHPNGVQDCTPASTLFPGNGSTNAIGAWTGTGSFDQTAVGAWTEWAQFPSGLTSNRITFNVSAPTSTSTPTSTALLTINGVTNGNFFTGQNWTLDASSNLPSQNVLICAIHPNGIQDCSPQLLGVNLPTTDASGHWNLVGSFPTNDPTVLGNWTEWLEFPLENNFSSNRVTFTVNASTTAPTSTVTVSLSPTSLNFTMQQGNLSSVLPQNSSVTFTVNPNQLISWTAQPSVPWLVPLSGVAQTTGSTQVAIGPGAVTLTPGTYFGSLVFSPSIGATSTFAQQTVLVALTVQGAVCQVNCGGGATTSTVTTVVTGLQNSATATIKVFDATGNATNSIVAGNGTIPFVLPLGHLYAVTATTSAANYTVLTSSNCAGTLAANVTCAISFTLGTSTATSTSTSSSTANLAITKSIDNTAPQSGATIHYAVTVSALGPATSTGVVATDALPSGTSFQNATASKGSYASSTGAWTIGDMGASSTATLQIAATVNASVGQTVTNIATVGESASSTNTNTNGSTASSTFTVATAGGGGGTQADIAVTKTVDAAFPKGGDVVHFLVTVTALGPAPSTFVVAHDLLPTGLSLVTATASQGLYNLGTGDWNVGTVNPNATATLALATTILPNAAGQTIVNTATVSELGSLIDGNPANNSSSVSVFVQSTSSPTANLSVTKSVDAPAPAPNATVNYTITVKALGPATSTGVVSTDILPSGLGFVSATPSAGSYASSTGAWTIGDMSAGSTVTLKIAATVNAAAGTVIVNNVAVGESASSTNLTSASSTASSTITVTTPGISTATTTPSGGGSPCIGCNGTVGVGSGGGLYYFFDIKINGGAPTTDSQNVTLTLSATGANQMWISNDSSFPSSTLASGTSSSSLISVPTSTSTGWIPFNATYPWELTSGSGNKTVYARFGSNRIMNGSAQASIQLIGGGGQVLGTSTSTVGQVLGTSATCSLYLYEYIHPGRKNLNNPNEVKKLQTFLNMYLSDNLSVTGDYDSDTIAAVNQFQLQNNQSVLAPWVPYGLPNDMTPTGYVYKTTQRWINLIVCPPLDLPMPQLP
jgi:uncharacterized repeat protein (TIGR01451 family)